MKRFALGFLFVFGLLMIGGLFAGCGSVPHELVTANAAEKHAAEALARDEARIIKGYDTEVRRLAGALLDSQRAAKIRAAAIAAVPAARIAEINAARDKAIVEGTTPAEADARRTAALQEAALAATVPIDILESIDASCSRERAEIMASWEKKREELLDAPNREILFQMNAAVGRYLGSLDSAAREIESLVDGAGKVK